VKGGTQTEEKATRDVLGDGLPPAGADVIFCRTHGLHTIPRDEIKHPASPHGTGILQRRRRPAEQTKSQQGRHHEELAELKARSG